MLYVLGKGFDSERQIAVASSPNLEIHTKLQKTPNQIITTRIFQPTHPVKASPITRFYRPFWWTWADVTSTFSNADLFISLFMPKNLTPFFTEL
jgi:hypothetical protein